MGDGDDQDNVDSNANVFVGEYPEIGHQYGDFWESGCWDVKIDCGCGPLGG